VLSFTVTFDSLIPMYLARWDDDVNAVVSTVSQEIAAFAAGEVRIETGSLKESIDAEADPENVLPYVHKWQVSAGNLEGGYLGGGRSGKAAGTPVAYAAEQEYGGGDGSYQPYMTPASEQGWELFLNAMMTVFGS
jgi:hypothetical protein